MNSCTSKNVFWKAQGLAEIELFEVFAITISPASTSTSRTFAPS